MNTNNYKNVAIVGASGSIGSIILQGLIESSKFNITALSRYQSNAAFPSQVTVRKTDFSSADLEDAFKDQDVVISALGLGGFGEQQKLVDAAVRAGVKRFLPSEFSANSEDAAVVRLLPLFGEKKALIEYLRSKESEGLSWTGLAVGLLFDWGLGNGFLEYDLKKHTATIWDDGNKRFTLTNQKALGQGVAAILERPQETSNRYLYIYSVETSQNEILESLEEVTGNKWTVQRTTTDEQLNEARIKMDAGDVGGAYALIRATSYSSSPGLRANYTKEEDLVNDLLGINVETVKATVRRVFEG